MKNSNRLIAEFMGLETPDGVYFEHLTKNGERSKLTHFMLLEYHISWDWLMPVVMKISRKIDKPLDEVVSRLTEVGSDNIWDVKSLHNAVVEFINEYNQKKPTR